MNCTCPKCLASIEAEQPDSPEKGGTVRCPECNGRFWAHLEPFQIRAYKKDWKLFCSNCGQELGTEIHCPNCATLQPDYWVVQPSKPAKRLPQAQSASFELFAGGSRRRTFSYDAAGGETRAVSSKRYLVPLIIVAVLVALGFVGVTKFMGNKVDRQFSENYILALYGIKSGTDLSLTKFNIFFSTGQIITAADRSEMTSAKDEIDAVMAKLTPTPEIYQDSMQRLTSLYGCYQQLYQLSAATADGAKAEEVKKLEDAFNRRALELKNALTPDLAEELNKKVSRYKSLQFLVQ